MNSKIFNLSKRLSLCANFVRSGAKLADVGTDHAYLPIYLLQTNKIVSAVACDINSGPLECAMANSKRFGLEDKMTLKLSDGLEKVEPHEADDIVIAGMGAELILKIIMAAKWTQNAEKHLILQPMTKSELLREELFNCGFDIKDEKAVFEDGKVYSVMSVLFVGKKQACSETMKYMGRIKPNSEYADLYAKKVIKSLNKKATGCELKGDKGKAGQIRDVIAEIEDTYLCGGN